MNSSSKHQPCIRLPQASRQAQTSGLMMGHLTFIYLAEHPAAQDLLQADAIALQDFKAPGVI